MKFMSFKARRSLLLFCLFICFAVLTARPALADWKVALNLTPEVNTTFSHDLLWIRGYDTPPSYASHEGLNLLSGLITYHEIYGASTLTGNWLNDVYATATLTWVGSGSVPTQVVVDEVTSSQVVFTYRKGINGNPGTSVSMLADVFNVPTTPNFMSGPRNQSADASFTTTYTVPSNGIVVLPTRRIKCNLSWNVAALAPADRPSGYDIQWGYFVSCTEYLDHS